nr:MAG TPA: hypothetical protein [Caudoviricetes sp.]
MQYFYALSSPIYYYRVLYFELRADYTTQTYSLSNISAQ